jgi:uncharacterized repeat protein (TIGR01451 family)
MHIVRVPRAIPSGVTPKFQYLVPCTTTDGTVLTNSVTVTGTDTDGIADPYVSDNTAKATTTIQAPKLTVALTASATVNAGEVITYTIVYGNTGTGGASKVTATVTLSAGVYYSQALDLGTGPRPDTVTLDSNGTRTLVWNIGTLGAGGTGTITFTTRPTLLALAGTVYTNNVSLGFSNASGACTFDPALVTRAEHLTAQDEQACKLLGREIVRLEAYEWFVVLATCLRLGFDLLELEDIVQGDRP